MNKDSILKRPVAKALVIQVVIVVLLLGWFKFGLPRMEKARAASEVAKREVKITDLFQSVTAEDPTREVEAPAAGGPAKAHPKRLRITLSPDEMERTLGAPDAFYIDFRRGRHLIWKGSIHKLEASFDDHGRLYCLRTEDTRTGHGSLVFESTAQWHPF